MQRHFCQSVSLLGHTYLNTGSRLLVKCLHRTCVGQSAVKACQKDSNSCHVGMLLSYLNVHSFASLGN